MIPGIESLSGPPAYLALAALAAMPLAEVYVVAPLGVGLGLDPFAVGVATFTGKLAPVYAIHLADRRYGLAGPAWATSRAEGVWRRHGVPGLSLAAPGLGVYACVSVAVALDAPRRSLLAWTTASLALWTTGVTVLSAA
ncbi:MAG: hypothetical protein ACOCT0_06675, partial [Halobacteriota archaeon]